MEFCSCRTSAIFLGAIPFDNCIIVTYLLVVFIATLLHATLSILMKLEAFSILKELL